MKNFLQAGALLAVATGAAAQSNGCAEESGNWYCNAVDTIQYTNFGSTGSYNQVTNMDISTGACSQSPLSYSGSLAPLDGEVSIHIRGPISLQQFAAFTPGSGNSKRSDTGRHAHRHGHGHSHFHKHDKQVRAIQEKAERGLGSEVTAVINGVTVSWANTYGEATDVPNPAGNIAGAANSVVSSVVAEATGALGSLTGGGSGSTGSGTSSQEPAYSGDWVQSALYNAANSSAYGLTFLNHNGGQGSGQWNSFWGNSLSYASSDGQSGCASPQVLENAVLPSNTEVVIMTDSSCSDGKCSTYWPESVAYHGFDGANKIFMFEFSMPHQTGGATNSDMPAIWMLNAEIARTVQYGSAECCCWQSGCGEFDLFEVLTTGSEKAKSTLHGNIAGGSSDYFQRPSSGNMMLAVIMTDSQATIKVLDSSYTIPTTLSDSDVSQLMSGSQDALSNLFSTFALGS